MKIISFFCLLLTGLCFASSDQMETINYPNVAFINGNAYIYDLEANERMATKGGLLSEGEVIRTEKDSLLVISLKERVKVKIGPSSVVELEGLIRAHNKNAANDPKSDNLFIHAGHIFVDYLKQMNNTKLNVNTKYTSLGVRGTQFFVHLDNSDESKYTMAVNSGEVIVSSKSNTRSKLSVKKGEGTLLDPNGRLAPKTKYKWIKKLNWNLDPSKGNLATEKIVFEQIRKNWENYSKKVIQKRDSFFDSQKRKFNRYNR